MNKFLFLILNFIFLRSIFSMERSDNLDNLKLYDIDNKIFEKDEIELVDLELKASINNRSLHFAVIVKDVDMVERIALNTTNINIINDNNQTPLHLACKNEDNPDNQEIVTILLDYGANINIRDKNNETALHYAISSGSFEIAELLIKRKDIDINCINNNQKTPLDLLIKEKTNNNNTNYFIDPSHLYFAKYIILCGGKFNFYKPEITDQLIKKQTNNKTSKESNINYCDMV